MIVVLDEASMAVSCPGCGGSLKPWGYARTRVIRERGGLRRITRPRRARCRGCLVTHVLLPAAVCVPHRADSPRVILGALLANAGGRGHRTIAADLALPSSTVRGWLRRARKNAERVRTDAMRLAVEFDPLLGQVDPVGSVLGDALNALGVAVAAARRRLGPVGSPIGIAMIIGKMLLHPLQT